MTAEYGFPVEAADDGAAEDWDEEEVEEMSEPAEELAVGQLRRQRALGSEALYRVGGWDADRVRVEVVEAPGLQSGDEFTFTRDAVSAMKVVQDLSLVSERREASSPPDAMPKLAS
jgi:hypothetical protein